MYLSLQANAIKWYDQNAKNPPWIKAHADVRRMGTLEGYCFLLTAATICSEPSGRATLPAGRLPRILATQSDTLSPRMQRAIKALAFVSSMNASRVVERDRGARQTGRWVRTADQHPRHRIDHLQRHGCGNRSRRCLRQGAGLRHMARPGPKANLDR